jgi:two-component system, LytTR family, response regulator
MNLAEPLRVIIVEDQITIRRHIEGLLRKQPGFIMIGVCGTVHDAVVLINSTKPDLLLLDIELPDGTGFDILEQITVQTKVIFVTAHNEFAIRAIRCGALDYLLKPLDERELQAALQRVISAQPLLQEQIDITLHSFKENKPVDYIALRSRQSVKIVALKDIAYLQGDNGYTTFFLNGGNREVTTKSLKYYEELFPDTSFLRTHQSYLVNKLYIDLYQSRDSIVWLKDGTRIPVSERKKEMIAKYIKTL